MSNRKTPTINEIEIEKYRTEIAYWQQRYDEANIAKDWSARNWAGMKIRQKKANLEILLTCNKKRHLNNPYMV